ncbi:hypothetical protein DFH09DRAFT_1281346 [Mycena vulgaris]|nr:hypothetical protein DFH09DRAFT_1281346 [Mycena vulgaris]
MAFEVQSPHARHQGVSPESNPDASPTLRTYTAGCPRKQVIRSQGNGNFSLGLLSHPDAAASNGAGTVVDARGRMTLIPDVQYLTIRASESCPTATFYDLRGTPLQRLAIGKDQLCDYCDSAKPIYSQLEYTLREEGWSSLFSADISDTETAGVGDMLDALERMVKVENLLGGQERLFKEFKEMMELDWARIEATTC